MNYDEFLNRKTHYGGLGDITDPHLPDFLFDFQKSLVDWAVRKGRASIFADCGLGKTPMELVWADNIVRKTNGRVLCLTPLAVAHQTIDESVKFDIEAHRSVAGELYDGIVVSNYERLHFFNPNDFAGVVCDESSILKSFDGSTRLAVTEFMKKIKYRLLATATAAPNDYIELGTSSEALGDLGYTDMLTKFFKNDQNTIKPMVYRHHGSNFEKLDDRAKWRFKGHAELAFWRWVCSWARAMRKPSDLGFDDGKFILPPLVETEHLVRVNGTPDGMLFNLPAVGLKEQREERRRTVTERCERVAEICSQHNDQSLIWCHLNDEGDLLQSIVKDAVQVSGKDSDESKEEKFIAFSKGQITKLVTKPKIGAWGLNFQRCNHITFFPSHSFEQYYQGVRRCWRFGQERPVNVDIVTTEGEAGVMKNLQRKAKQAERMFESLVSEMNNSMAVNRDNRFTKKQELPSWL